MWKFFVRHWLDIAILAKPIEDACVRKPAEHKQPTPMAAFWVKIEAGSQRCTWVQVW
jgi:hypothetical protein